MNQRLLPVFSALSEPDFRPIVQLHRGNDGHVAFARRGSDGEWINEFSIPARDLEGYFPQLRPTFEADGYFSVNAFWLSQSRRSTPARNMIARDLGLPATHRDERSLRWITSAFVDLDCYRLGISAGDAVGAVINAQDRGDIPPASMLCRSGRGLWVFWFLRSDEESKNEPVRAWPETIRHWVNIQATINRQFTGLAADVVAKAAATMTRIPGSVNPKAGRRVDYWIQAGSDGKPFVYRMGELSEALGVRVPARHPQLVEAARKLSERGQKGQRGRWWKARRSFERLWEWRGSFGEGVRNNAIWAYASILRSQRLDEDLVWTECNRLYQSFEQGNNPFSYLDFESAMRAKGFRFGGVRNQTLADMLDVTPEESAILEGAWPCAERFGQRVDQAEADKLSASDRRTRRRGLLRRKCDELGYVPPLRDLAAWLNEQGLPTVPATIREDLAALKIQNPRKRRKRARAKQRKIF